MSAVEKIRRRASTRARTKTPLYPRLKPYCGRGDRRGIVCVDPRTPAGRRLNHIRRGILAELGPNITRRKRLLVEDVVMITYRLNLFNAKMMTGEFSEYDDTIYLSFVANRRRHLQTLGLDPSFADLMKK